MSQDKAESPAASRAVAHQVTVLYDYPMYQALRRAKRSLNGLDDILWRWRYAWVLGVSFVFMLAYGSWLGLTAEDFLSWDFLAINAPIYAGLAVFIAVVDGLFALLTRWFFKRFAMANKMLSVALTPDTILWWSDGFQGEIAWAKVIRIVTLKDYVFFFISKMEAVGLSRQAAASDEAFDNLVAYAKERVNAQAL